MRTFIATSILVGSSALLFGCSGDDTAASTTDASTSDATSNDSSSGGDSMTGSDSAADAGSADSSADSTTAADGDAGGVTLTIDDYLTWCSVTINGGAPSTAAIQTITVAPGTTVMLHADTAGAAFVWGYWVGTDADASTHDTTMQQSVVVNQNMKVQSCCPLVGTPNTPCPYTP